MNERLNVGDCVQLSNGFTPKMTISEIVGDSAKCVWFDIKARKIKIELVPLNALKLFVERERINVDDVLRSLRR
jgi:uncharacterized protein YodC (DUF2158 family)